MLKLSRVVTLILACILVGCAAPTTDGDFISPSPPPAVGLSPEVIPAPLSATIAEETRPDPGDADSFLKDIPLFPTVSDAAREIYQKGLSSGRNPQVFTKVGDCMTASDYYLAPFSVGQYDLGEYAYLQEVVDYYSEVTIREVDGQPVNSFSNPSLAASCGFNSAGPLNPLWADPNWCESDETPLACELRVSNASIVLIQLGTHDMYYTTEDFHHYLDTIVQESIEAGVLPIIFTFPNRLDRLDQVPFYDQVVVDIAAYYDVPLVNLWLAFFELENYGVASDHVDRPSMPDDECATCFTDDNLTTGSTIQNWIALHALYEVGLVLRDDLANP